MNKFITQAIWEDYAPRVDGKGKPVDIEALKVAHEDLGTYKVDPGVLWVGSFIDGLLELTPEMWFDRDGGWDVSGRPVRPEGRRGLKLYFMDVLRDRSANMGAGDVVSRVVMMRERWGVRKGEPLKLALTRERVIDMEPGAITFEPVPVVDVETGEVLLVDPVERVKGASLRERVRRPMIRTDRQFGLHYLLRGDRFIFEWVTRRKENFIRTFELRAKGEGSSEIVAERREDLVVF